MHRVILVGPTKLHVLDLDLTHLKDIFDVYTQNIQ